MGYLTHLPLSCESKKLPSSKGPWWSLPTHHCLVSLSLAHSNPLPLGVEMSSLAQWAFQNLEPDGGGDKKVRQNRRAKFTEA